MDVLIRNEFFEKLETGKVLLKRVNYVLCLITSDVFLKQFPTWDDMLWDRQRPIEQKSVDRIITYIDEKHDDGLKLINQTITIATVNGANPRIIDGQHRLSAVLKLHHNTEFFLSCGNYTSENDRFIEFIKINSNTPLPVMYKDIFDVDDYYKTAAKYISAQIAIKYPDYIKIIHDDTSYYTTPKKIEEKMFECLQSRHVTMSDIASMAIKILHELESSSLFPRTSSLTYPCPKLKDGCCLSQKNAIDHMTQCHFQGKIEYGGFCGHHKLQKHKYNSIHIRNKVFTDMKAKGHDFFLLDPNWCEKVIDQLFLLNDFIPNVQSDLIHL